MTRDRSTRWFRISASAPDASASRPTAPAMMTEAPSRAAGKRLVGAFAAGLDAHRAGENCFAR